MFGLDLFSESVKMNNEACCGSKEVKGYGEEYSPDEEGMAEIQEACLEESLALESAVLLAAGKHARLLKEGKEAEAVALQENVVKNFFGKVKALIIKMWNRIKDFFKSVKLFFQSLVQKESKFAETYGDEIKAISSVKIQGYKFNFGAVSIKNIWSSLTDKYSTVIEDMLSDVKDKSKEEVASHIKNNIDHSDTDENVSGIESAAKNLADKKFNRKSLLAAIGRTPKTVEVTYTGSQLLSILTNLNAQLNVISKEQNEVDSAYKSALAKISTIESKLSGVEEASQDTKAISAVSSFLKSSLSVINTAAGIKAGCLKEECAQAKKAAYKGIAEARKSGKGEKSKTEAVKESFDVSTLYADLLG